VADAVTRLAAGARQAGRWLLDALLPPQCLTCDAAVEGDAQFCAACFRDVGFVTAPCCVACGVPFAHAAVGSAAGLCPACELARPPWGRARGALRYEPPGQAVLLAFKYADRPEHAAGLARLMRRAGAALLAEAELLVPVPLHRTRLRARRYNQSALLARALGRLAGRPVLVDGLVRLRATQPLTALAAEARAATVKDAFAVRPARAASVSGRRVLLIDDVMTSGATAAACTRALLAGGAAGVDVLVAARVADPRLQ
jgi:ComF family protein